MYLLAEMAATARHFWRPQRAQAVMVLVAMTPLAVVIEYLMRTTLLR
jgi:hypothetical protein